MAEYTETALVNILRNLPTDEVIQLCQTSPTVHTICKRHGLGPYRRYDGYQYRMRSPRQSNGLLLPISSEKSLPQSSTGLLSTNQSTGLISPSQTTELLSPNRSTALVSPSRTTGLVPSSQTTGLLSPNRSTALVSPSRTTGLVPSSRSMGFLSPSRSSGLAIPSEENEDAILRIVENLSSYEIFQFCRRSRQANYICRKYSLGPYRVIGRKDGLRRFY